MVEHSEETTGRIDAIEPAVEGAADTAAETAAEPAFEPAHALMADGRPVGADREIAEGESPIAVIAAVVANIAIGIVKFIAAAISGSSAMFSEGIHSIVDSGNGLLILLGIKRSERPADVTHPFGHGKELYFWTMVVSILIFAMGGGVSIWEGVKAIQEVGPETKLGDPTMAYIILGISAVIEGISLSIALRQFNQARGAMKPLAFIKEAKDPSLFTVVLEDSAALAGLIVAFLGVFVGHVFNNPYFDGAAAVVVGLILCGVATILLRETKGLLIGEGMNRTELNEVRAIVEADPLVEKCGRILSMYMGPHNLVVALDANFKSDCTAGQVLQGIDRIEKNIVERFPQTETVFIEAEGIKQIQSQMEQYNIQPVTNVTA